MCVTDLKSVFVHSVRVLQGQEHEVAAGCSETTLWVDSQRGCVCDGEGGGVLGDTWHLPTNLHESKGFEFSLGEEKPAHSSLPSPVQWINYCSTQLCTSAATTTTCRGGPQSEPLTTQGKKYTVISAALKCSVNKCNLNLVLIKYFMLCQLLFQFVKVIVCTDLCHLH